MDPNKLSVRITCCQCSFGILLSFQEARGCFALQGDDGSSSKQLLLLSVVVVTVVAYLD